LNSVRELRVGLRAGAFSKTGDWRTWLTTLFPRSVDKGFAPHHETFWRWVWAITEDSDPPPFIGVWPRGGGKSTSAELAAAALGVRGKRHYAVYVRSTQERADDSVQNIGALLESRAIELYYPEHGERRVNKFGDSRGWRRNRLWTEGGFVVDALGLDTARTRGVKLEDQRPDLLVFDDLDDRHDSSATTEKKLDIITTSLLPAGTDNVAIMGIQNLIIPTGIFARIVDGRADFLTGRILSGPFPAIRNLALGKALTPDGAVRHVITGGEPVWEGQDLEACQRLIDWLGLSAFIRECQNNVAEREGALWSRELLNRTRVVEYPPLARVVVGVDPSGGRNEIGIVVAGKDYNGHGYVLGDYTAPGELGPKHWASQVARAYHDFSADRVVAEKNFGGDMVAATIRGVEPNLPVKLVTAARGKAIRAEPIAAYYEDERVHHVGAFDALETEMTSWVPGDPESPNRLDAAVWALTELLLVRKGTRKLRVIR
jgi:hypothetical protein